MGFIDWLKKDKDVKVDDEDVVGMDQDDDLGEQNDFNDDDLSSLKELSNSEREESLNYNNDDEDDDEDDSSFGLSNNDNAYNPYGYSSQPQNASFTIFKVGDEEDVRQVLKHLSTNAPCIASFDRIKKKEYSLIMKYLEGGLFVMGANMSEWQNNAYILVPKGMSINMQEKSKRKK